MKNLSIIGHVTDNIKLSEKDGKNGKYYSLFFSMGVNSDYLDENGEKQQKTDWISCFVNYNKEPKKLMAFFKKGLQVYAQGEPSFNLQNTDKGVFVNTILNVQNWKILTPKNSK